MKRELVFWLMLALGSVYPFVFYVVQEQVNQERGLIQSRLTLFCNVEGTHCISRDRAHPPRPYGELYLKN